jgi:rare lipoprotein A
MDPRRLTAAHPTLPFGTKVAVENVENGRTVVVRVNDRGPYADGRIIDVSKEAARKLGMVEDGVTEVEVAPVPTESVDDPGEPIIE